jgi:hypothetical protein
MKIQVKDKAGKIVGVADIDAADLDGLVLASESDRPVMIHASGEDDLIYCRGNVGAPVKTSKPWKTGEPVSFIYAPAGKHMLTAGFKDNERIAICVQVDKDTPALLQASFDRLTANVPKQEPYGDEEHEAKKATIRFPVKATTFSYGKIKGEEGVIVSGGEPTSYGAEAVNGKMYRSWSPTFATDADYDNAVANQATGRWEFPDGIKGSASNPARMIGVNFEVGALTNCPAFKEMPPVKASAAKTTPAPAPKVKASDDDCGKAGCMIASGLANTASHKANQTNHADDHETAADLHTDAAKLHRAYELHALEHMRETPEEASYHGQEASNHEWRARDHQDMAHSGRRRMAKASDATVDDVIKASQADGQQIDQIFKRIKPVSETPEQILARVIRC